MEKNCPGECRFPLSDRGDYWYCSSWNCSTSRVEKTELEKSWAQKAKEKLNMNSDYTTTAAGDTTCSECGKPAYAFTILGSYRICGYCMATNPKFKHTHPINLEPNLGTNFKCVCEAKIEKLEKDVEELKQQIKMSKRRRFPFRRRGYQPIPLSERNNK